MLARVFLLSLQLIACRVALEVEVSVEAAWPAASLAAELLEGLSHLDRGAAFLRTLAEVDVEKAKFQQRAVEIAEQLLCCQGQSIYGRLLSLRARHAFASAVVEAARGMERADRAALEEQNLLNPQSCAIGEPWILLQSPRSFRVLCGEEVAKLADLVFQDGSEGIASGQRGAPRQSGLDHVLYDSSDLQNDTADSVLEICGYADLGDPNSASKLLRAISKAADLLQASGKVARVIFRHATPAGSPPRAVLGGFGLELMTRSADEVAKSTDNDTEASESSTVSRDSSCLNEVADPAESFHGIDISKIAKNFPSGSSALCQLRSDLVAEAEKPPLPWELTRLGARAAWRAKQMAENSDALQGLRSMGEVAQDYPSGWARALSAGDANAAHARELMAFAEDIKVSDSLQVNGWKVPLKQRGILPLLRASLPLFRAVELLASSGLSQSLALELLRNAQAGAKPPSKVDTGDPRLGHEAVAFDLGGKVVGAGLLMNLCNLKHLKFIQKVLKNRPPAVLWLRFDSPSHPALAPLMESALKELIKSKAGSEAAKKMLKRFASKRTDKDLCNDAVDRIQQAFRELWPNKDAPKLPSGSGSRLPFPVPSASINGRIVSGLDLLERTLEQEIQRETEMISFSFMQLRRRADQLPLQQITNFAYGPKHLHPMFLQMEPKLLTAWYPGISAVSPRHVPLRPEHLAALPRWTQPATGPPVLYVALLGAKDPLKLMQDTAEILRAFHDLWSLTGEQPKRYLHLAVPQCSNTATVPSVLHACLGQAINKTTALKGLAEALASLMDVTSEKLEATCSEALGESINVDVESCKAVKPILKDTGTDTALWVNGRLYGPLELDGSLNFAILQHAEQLGDVSEDADEALQKLKDANVSDYAIAYVLAVRARAVAEGFAARSGEAEDEAEQTQDARKTESAYYSADPSLQLHVAPKGEIAPLRIFSVMDPLGQAAQRLPALLQLLHEELDAEIFLALRPQRLAESPLTGYFRTAPVPKMSSPGLPGLATWDGHLPGVRIELPPRRGQLLSAQLNAPDAWLCSAVDSGGADLDNIRADARRGSAGAQVRVRYVVEALFLEGFAEDGMGRPATGRQLALAPLRGTESAAGSDSVVVKSGYFQLRQTPGVFQLALQTQKAEKLVKPKGLVHLTDLAGRGSLLETLLMPGERQEDPYAKLFATKNSDSTKTFEGAGGDRKKCKETIHIFSVASGLRYERLLRIMMMSVRKHTKCPLRFWLVENFLSASFRRMLPGLAAEVGFAVSTVTYKWPTWLREQVQKQRVIWAYKILFLDVFFPGEVKRILFIDADQIVRADVRELWELDIEGKVYGFVPFCGSGPSESLSSSMWKSLTGKAAKQEDLKNPDTVGFRFWEQGFWKSHLRDRHFYHISALFVVDLVAFRQRGAGDILRDVYQSLTADPHSLANLDQDLPNYIQANLPIHSLPQEWLWCESWCSESSKKNAKTIDMCQHPSKKEGKLQQARRIAPEWTQYDEELQRMIDKLET